MPSLLARLTTAAALLAAVPASATAAPALSPLEPCYTAVSRGDTEPVRIEGSGFAPNGLVDISVDGEPAFRGVLVDGAGRFGGTVPAPFVRSGQRRFAVKVTEQGDGGRTVRRRSLVTRLGVRVTPRRATPSSRVRFRGRGFTADRGVFAHYVRKGEVRRTVRIARRTTGRCGGFDVRRRQFPFRPRVGRWTIQVDQQRAYRKAPDTPFVRLGVSVRRG